jgi:hypothetical protein
VLLQNLHLHYAAGKNHVANHFADGIKMKDTVRRRRDGWYGNAERYEEGDDKLHAVTDCKKLVQHSIGCADSTFIPLCDGINLEQLVHLPLMSTISVTPLEFQLTLSWSI